MNVGIQNLDGENRVVHTVINLDALRASDGQTDRDRRTRRVSVSRPSCPV